MKKKILVIGAEMPTGILLRKMIEEHGETLDFFTVEEAKEQGIDPNEFANIPTYKIEAPMIHDNPMMVFNHLSERVGKGGRARKRSSFKNRKW